MDKKGEISSKNWIFNHLSVCKWCLSTKENNINFDCSHITLKVCEEYVLLATSNLVAISTGIAIGGGLTYYHGCEGS